MAYDGTNENRTSPTWDEYWTKETKIEQLRDNQDAVESILDDDHSMTTGKHTAKNAATWISGLDITAHAALALTNTVNDTAAVDILTGNTSRTDTGPASYPQLSNDLVGGIANCKGDDATGGEAEAVLTMYVSATARVRNRHVRRAAGSVAGDFKPLTVFTEFPGYRIGRHLAVASPENQSIVRRDLISDTGAPYARNFYDRLMTNTAAIKDAVNVRHDGSNLSEAITLEEIYGGGFTPAGFVALDQTAAFNTTLIGPHDGNMMAVVPAGVAVTGTTEEASICPGFDDENLYLISWTACPGLNTAGTLKTYQAATTFRLDLPASASFTGSFDIAWTVAQADAIDQDFIAKLVKNDEILDKLYLAEHRGYSGLHALGVDRFTGYTVVLNNTTVSASGVVGTVSAHTIEAWPGTDPIYLVGIKGAAGAGIVMLTLGGSETTAKFYLRPVTVGTSNSYTVRVIRINRA